MRYKVLEVIENGPEWCMVLLKIIQLFTIVNNTGYNGKNDNGKEKGSDELSDDIPVKYFQS